MDTLIEAHCLRKSFRDTLAVDDVNLQIEAGQIYGLIGPDGAGKTTVMRLLCGALRPSSTTSKDPGSESAIFIAGIDLLRTPEAARVNIGYLAQRFALYEELTVLENLRFLAEVRGLPSGQWQARCMEILAFVGLADYKNRRAGQLSGGMKQKLGLAAALVHRPSVLLLDEPTTGVDPVTRQDFWQLIIHLVGEGEASGRPTAVLVSTPYMDEAARCARIGLMQKGRVMLEGTPGELRARLDGRVVELVGEPLMNIRRLVAAYPEVEDVQAFGDRLHIRTAAGQADAIIQRVEGQIPATGAQIRRVRVVAPSLEDVFMDLTGGRR